MSIDPFRDRVAVITGGASGIGRAMANGFAARGAHLVLADIDEAASTSPMALFSGLSGSSLSYCSLRLL